MKQTNIMILFGLVLVLILSSCTTTSSTRSYEDLDQEPDICSEYEKDRFTRDAERKYEDALDDYEDALENYEDALENYEKEKEDWLEDHDNLDDFSEEQPILNVSEPTLSLPTGFDIETHVLIYDGSNNELYRNLTFNININQLDLGLTETVSTTNAKASFTTRHDFGELNELEIRVTPVLTDDEFVPKTYIARKFVPCDDDAWIIKIPYILMSNDSIYADELEDTDNIKIDGADYRVTESNPEPATINEVLEFRFELKSAEVVTVEYNPDQVKNVKVYYGDELLDQTIKPEDETVFRDGNRESAFGPIKSGDYRLIVFTNEEQPSTRIEIKTFEDNEVEEAGTIYFSVKEFKITREFLEDENNRIFVVVFLIIVILLSQLKLGGKK